MPKLNKSDVARAEQYLKSRGRVVVKNPKVPKAQQDQANWERAMMLGLDKDKEYVKELCERDTRKKK